MPQITRIDNTELYFFSFKEFYHISIRVSLPSFEALGRQNEHNLSLHSSNFGAEIAHGLLW